MTSLTRRRFLVRTAIAAAALGSGVQGVRSLRDAFGHRPLDEQVLHIFRHRESARRLGRAYLAARPEEASVRFLLEGLAHLPRAGSNDLRHAIVAANAADFAAGRVVRVDGWILSQTEARACAIVALRA